MTIWNTASREESESILREHGYRPLTDEETARVPARCRMHDLWWNADRRAAGSIALGGLRCGTWPLSDPVSRAVAKAVARYACAAPSEYTPGPWTTADDGAIYRADGATLVVFPADDSFDETVPGPEEMDANRRLIIEAPEMAGTLAELVRVWDSFDDDGPQPLDAIVTRARDILARIKGGE